MFLIDKRMTYPGWLALLPTLGTLLLISAGPAAWVNQALLSRRLWVGIGLISYPLYLWHWPLLVMLRQYEIGEPSKLMKGLVVMVSIGAAVLTYQLLEKRAQRGALAFTSAVSVVAIASIIFISIALIGNHGFTDRRTLRMEQKEFVASYNNLHLNGLRKVYRAECDFYDWDLHSAKSQIDASCLASGSYKTVLLWGDSHAQALGYGIANSLPGGYQLSQVATSGCKPFYKNYEQWNNPLVPFEACTKSNALAMAEIRRARPDIVILAQSAKHEETNWVAFSDEIIAAGAKAVFIVGPVPQWRPTLPEIYAKHYWLQQPVRIALGLDESIFYSDSALVKIKFKTPNIKVISLLDKICDSRGCTWHVSSQDEYNLLAVDYGHLSPAGSIFVGELLVREMLLER